MSLTGVLNTAVTGIMTNQTALRVTAANIANVNTEDYSRQVVNLETLVVSGTSLGVGISGIQRIVDRFLQAAGFDANSRSFESDIQRQFHDRLQGVIGRPDSESNIAARISRVYGSLAELALNPANSILRQSTLSAIQDTADEVSRIAQTIQGLRGEANQQIADNVDQVNAALRRIHELNPQIVRQRAVGGETGGLENQRDKALQDLAEIIDIRIATTDSGIVSVTTGSGTVLLDTSLRELEYTASGIVTAETLLEPIQIFRLDPLSGERVGSSRDFDQDVDAGRLRGLLDLRDRDLRDLSLTLGEFAGAFVDDINAIHNAHSAVPALNEMVGRQTSESTGGAMFFAGVADFAITDSDGLLVQKVSYDFTAAGSADYNDLIASVNAGLAGAGTLSMVNGVITFAATDPTHGVVISDDPANPSQRGGRSFSHYFGMNDLLEAAVEANFDTGLPASKGHNIVAGGQTFFEILDADGRLLRQYTLNPAAAGTTYTALMDDLNDTAALGSFVTFSMDANGRMIISENGGFEGVRLSVVSDTTDIFGTGVSLTELFGIGDRYLVDRSKGINVLTSIKEQPLNMALAALDRTAAVGDVAVRKGDQSGAIALQALDTAVTSFEAAGQIGAASLSLGQYAAGFLSNAGLMASRAAQKAEDDLSLLNEIEARIGDVSGVNLDEELSNMVILQNAYNASARLIATSQEMMDELIGILR